MGLIDSHCHLDHFAEDRQDILTRARAAGIEHMVTISTRVRRFAEILAIAEAEPDVSCTVGTHPHQAEEETDVTLAELLELARHPKVVGIGETGLDYFYDNSPRDIQQASFRMHIRACLETGLPLIVHTRDADDDTARILREEGTGKGLTGVLHCFSSGRALAEAALEMGFYVSLSGILTFGKSEEIRAIVRDVPLDRLLVETDAPYLAPTPLRGKRNEPAFVVHTAAKLAEVKGVTPEAMARATSENFRRLFSRAA